MESDLGRTMRGNIRSFFGRALTGDSNRVAAGIEKERSDFILKDMDEIFKTFFPKRCK